MDIFEQIRKDIAENDVVLYMKGTADFPQCGFSGVVVSILHRLNVKFKDINVLEDNEIREAIKKFSDWPTIPQLYIKQEFVGGCDIIKEMYENGELQALLKEKKITE
ncbi:MAG: Grx4 family monothiol glutaredoxin [Wolbachia endosymbiont of Tyrophagus putrescentiae]|nr:Grx4 family monothiol glutaredoxin [Wolbachia endosymbiont of Tyrophagus putrescentiae]